MGDAAMLPLPASLPARGLNTGASVFAFSASMVESVTPATVTSIDEIPAVCLEDDLIRIFRLPRSQMRVWRKFPDFIPFPPLPLLDRQIRVSGCVVAWFLAQEAGEY